jgi:hypothetical protein
MAATTASGIGSWVKKFGSRVILSLVAIGIFLELYHTSPSEGTQDATIHGFISTKYGFQEDLNTLPQPKVHLEHFRHLKPHNFIADTLEPQETFATFLCTRNASLFDPYFLATLNLVYRNLWSPTIASKSRPFTVFVAPFTPPEQRDILAGAGAVIVELPLVLWEPTVSKVYDRWQDQFSKLHFWFHTEYSRIAFMDSDAFPIANIDSIFDEVEEQKCDYAKLTLEDVAEPEKEGLCEYVFAGVHDLGGGVNGGFLFVKPNLAMHKRLLREYQKTDQYEDGIAEQSFFKWHFAEDGAFALQELPRKYNAYFPGDEDEGQVSIVHEKLWALTDQSPEWIRDIWEEGWLEMVEYFDSAEFARAREADGVLETPQFSQTAVGAS